jgi:hypothetical protein
VHLPAQCFFDLFELHPHSITARSAFEQEFALSVFVANMRETKKRKSLWLPKVAAFAVLCGKATKFDQPCFLWVQ